MEHGSNDNSIARARTLSLSLSFASHSPFPLTFSPQEHSLQQAQWRIVALAAKGKGRGVVHHFLRQASAQVFNARAKSIGNRFSCATQLRHIYTNMQHDNTSVTVQIEEKFR